MVIKPILLFGLVATLEDFILWLIGGVPVFVLFAIVISQKNVLLINVVYLSIVLILANSSGPTNVGFEAYSAVRNDGYPFMWNFIPNVVFGPGTVTITTTSPITISRSTPIYGYEISQFSNNSSTMTINASLSKGGVFSSWRCNSSAGVIATSNTSFSPGWNTSYSDKSGTAHYKNIYQFYANAGF